MCTLHLSEKSTPPSNPLDHVTTLKGRWKDIIQTMISITLKTAAKFYGPAWLDDPDSSQLVSLAPEVSLPDCAAGSTWKLEGGQGGGPSL